MLGRIIAPLELLDSGAEFRRHLRQGFRGAESHPVRGDERFQIIDRSVMRGPYRSIAHHPYIDGGRIAANGLGGIAHHRDALLQSIQLLDRSEEHTSELQSLMRISYAVFCLNTKIT